MAVSLVLLEACGSDSVDPPFDCAKSDLSISLGTTSNVSSCTSNNGSITVQASGGTSPYQYRINGGVFSANGTFTNLGAGTYTVEVKDANGCSKTLSPSPTLTNATSTLAVLNVQKTDDTSCNGSNGSLTVTATGGTTPYSYKINNGNFSTNNVFTSLENGNYTITIKDAVNCEVTSNQVIARGATGISYQNEIKNIINASCNLAQCHSGSNALPGFTTYANVNTFKNSIKTKLSNNSMPMSPGTITAENRQKIICWIDDGAPNN